MDKHSEFITTLSMKTQNVGNINDLIRQLLEEDIQIIREHTDNRTVCYLPNSKDLDDLQKELLKTAQGVRDEAYTELRSIDDSFGSLVSTQLSTSTLDQQSSLSAAENDQNKANILDNSRGDESHCANEDTCFSSSSTFNVQQQCCLTKSLADSATTRPNSRYYKTELCRHYSNTSGRGCSYGDGCHFAHGAIELRCTPHHPRYKTQLCRLFHRYRKCRFGKRCQFIHDEALDELLRIRLQDQIFQTYREIHPEVGDVRLIELLRPHDDNLQAQNVSVLTSYDGRKLDKDYYSTLLLALEKLNS
ncbi:unnamed protein product [Heterobilharzia americana]|nr:unnamed protein product [Heterobilharzia americana]CAH8558107.1 unnamed protein product [Heterobilharzia americana]